jgi:hypothetical protein
MSILQENRLKFIKKFKDLTVGQEFYLANKFAVKYIKIPNNRFLFKNAHEVMTDRIVNIKPEMEVYYHEEY